MGFMKLRGGFYIIPEQDRGRDILSLIVLVSVAVPVSVPVLLSVITSYIYFSSEYCITNRENRTLNPPLTELLRLNERNE